MFVPLSTTRLLSTITEICQKNWENPMPPTASPEFPNHKSASSSLRSQPGQIDIAPSTNGGDEKPRGQGNAKTSLFRLFFGIVLVALIWQESPREIGRWYYAAYQDRSLDNDNIGALAMIEQAIDWDKENATYWLECGNTYMEMGDYKQSWSKFDQATKLLEPRVDARPNRYNVSQLAQALNGGAYARALGGTEFEQARKDVDQALDFNPASAAMIDTRGYICYLTGDYEQALFDTNAAVVMSTATYELYKQELQQKMLNSVRRRQLTGQLKMLEEVMAELHEHRGLVYQKLGKESAAQRDLTAAEMFKSRIVTDQ